MIRLILVLIIIINVNIHRLLHVLETTMPSLLPTTRQNNLRNLRLPVLLIDPDLSNKDVAPLTATFQGEARFVEVVV